MSMLDRWEVESIKKFRPLQASLELTNRCNERCSHCYIDSFKDDPARALELKDWFKILSELREAGVLYIILMGGEAMLSPFFWPILSKASDLGFHVSMITNGLKIKSQEIAKNLSVNGLSVATFSLYSMRPEIHDKMTRVKGSHQKTLQAIDYCLNVGIEPSINSLLTKDNTESIFEVYDWADSKNLQLKVDYNVTPKLSGNLEPTKLRASGLQLRSYFEKMRDRYPESLKTPSGETNKDFVCNAAKGKCAVTAYGELLSCIEIRRPLGNLAREKFSDIWYSKEANRWRNIKVGDLDNPDGLELQNFCDHCPGMASHEHGNSLKMTEFTKEVGHLRKDLWKSSCKG